MSLSKPSRDRPAEGGGGNVGPRRGAPLERPGPALHRFPLQFYSRGIKLGRGAQASVYLYVLDIRNLEKKEDREKFQELFVEQGGWPTHVAVKKLKADFSSDTLENIVKGRAREESLLRLLNHPNILALIGVHEHEETKEEAHKRGSSDTNVRSCLVMERCSGSLGDLLKKLGRGLLEWEASYLVDQILEATAYMHNENVIHRDIKPGNILLKLKTTGRHSGFELKHSGFEHITSQDFEVETFVVKVGDFGLSRKINKDDSQTLTAEVGTKFFLAPEVLDGKYNEKADIYSIALVTAVMLIGKRPAKVEDIDSRLKGASENAKDFINSVLSKKENPRDRPSAKELRNHPFITEPDRKVRMKLDSPIRRIRCMTSHIIVLCQDGSIHLLSTETKQEDTALSEQVNAALLKRSNSAGRNSGGDDNFPLATFDDSFAIPTSSRTVSIWKRTALNALPNVVTFGEETDGRITWLGLSFCHVMVLFSNGKVEARSLEDPGLKVWRRDYKDVNPWQVALDRKKMKRSLLTVVGDGGLEIQQVSIWDEVGYIKGVFRTKKCRLRSRVQGFTLAHDDDDKLGWDKEEESERIAEHALVWVSYESPKVVALYDMLDKTELLKISVPSYSAHVSRISYRLGMLFCHLVDGQNTWIIAYEQDDMPEVNLDDQPRHAMVFRSPKKVPFRVVEKYQSEWNMRPHQASHDTMVYGVEDTLHFLDRAGILAAKKVDTLN